MTTAAPKTTVETSTQPVKVSPAKAKKTTDAAPAATKAKPKASAKVAVKPAAKTVKKTVAKLAEKPVLGKATKPKKVKMVRDSFTMPKLEFAVLAELKDRAAQLALQVKKTELIRAGIKALTTMPDAAFLAAVKAVPNLKTGRPAKSK